MSVDETNGSPKKVMLFSGHMIDAPDREKPRFPANKESVAANAIAAALEELGAGARDLCICGGACGGDLLFAEAALARGARLELYIPFEEVTFLAKSVDFANRDWRVRFFSAKSHASLHVLPLERSATPEDGDPYEQNNLWMLIVMPSERNRPTGMLRSKSMMGRVRSSVHSTVFENLALSRIPAI